MWILVLGACNGSGDLNPDEGSIEDSTSPAVDTDEPTDTATPVTTPSSGVIEASCTLDKDHPLKVHCAATRIEAGPATLELSAPNANPRTFQSDEPLLEHSFLGWGLQADTAYDWTIGDMSGTVTTGPLPPIFDQAQIFVSGTPTGFDAALTPLTCDGNTFFVMIEGDGDIVWYAFDSVWNSNWVGYEWSQADRSVLTQNTSTLVERHVSGEELLHLERGVHFDDDIHHDVTRWGAYTYTIFSRRFDGKDVDGFYVFEGETLLGEFFLGDHYEITGGGFGGEWSHANGLNATDEGQIIFSLLNFDTVVSVDGDPASPTFLEITWTAAGHLPGLGTTDYVPATGPLEGFNGQHNASVHGDKLWVFDNTGVGGGSRALRLAMDHTAGTLTHEASWDIGRTCPIQSGAVPLDGGGVLASCQFTGEAAQFEEGSPDVVWYLDTACDAGLFALNPNRVIPVLIE